MKKWPYNDVVTNVLLNMVKRKFKQRWSTIPSVSTKQTTISHLNSLNTKQEAHLVIHMQIVFDNVQWSLDLRKFIIIYSFLHNFY